MSLPRELIVRVYNRYRIDFEMLDYSVDDVLLKAGYEPLQHEDELALIINHCNTFDWECIN